RFLAPYRRSPIPSPAPYTTLFRSNSLFGATVTCAGLLPGRAFREALASRPDLDLALVPAEALNDDQIFVDDLSLAELAAGTRVRSEEHTSELQSRENLVCRLLLAK